MKVEQMGSKRQKTVAVNFMWEVIVKAFYLHNAASIYF